MSWLFIPDSAPPGFDHRPQHRAPARPGDGANGMISISCWATAGTGNSTVS